MINIIETIQLAISNALSGLIVNAVWIILIYWGVKTISKEVPHWIESYWKKREAYLKLENAVITRNKFK